MGTTYVLRLSALEFAVVSTGHAAEHVLGLVGFQKAVGAKVPQHRLSNRVL